MGVVLAYRNSWTLNARVGPWTLDAGGCTLDTGLWTLDSGLWTLDHGRWTLNVGRWSLDAGLWTLNAGLWTLHSGLWTLDSELWSLLLTVVEQDQNPVSYFCLIKLFKTYWVRISRDHGHACSVEIIGSDVAIFRNSMLTLSVTL